MSWDAHVSNISLTFARIVRITSRNRHILPTKTKAALYYALFLSHLSYRFLVWGNNTTVTNVSKLLTLQKKMLRAMVNESYDSHTKHVYLQYNIVPVNRRFDYRFACMYKKLTARNDHFLSSVVSPTCRQSPYNVRKHYNFVLPKCRTNYGFSMLTYIVPKFLNTTLHDELFTFSISAIRKIFVQGSTHP
ncbi:uncharacterized protein LOC144143200 [Haemaphysalis longicornis]